MLLYKDSFATGLIGLIFLATLFGGRPLAYWFGQRFAGGGTHEGDAWWEDRRGRAAKLGRDRVHRGTG